MVNNGDRKKALLIALPNPNFYDPKIAPPLGLLYLASAVKDIADVTIIDLNIDDLPDHRLEENEYDVIGVSVMTSTYYIYRTLSWYIKAYFRGALLVAGGPHITSRATEVLKETPTDICIVGEGELSFWDAIVNGRNRIPDHTIIHNSMIPQSLFDEIKFPARELLDFSKYTRTIDGKSASNIITARGCAGKCIFCSQQTWNHKLRMHSAEYVLAEVDDIKEKTGIDRLLFLDDTLTVNKKRLLKICAGLKERNIIWRGWTRSDYVDKEMLVTMKDSGCYSICFGIESGSQKVLDIMKKKITVEQNQKAIRIAKNAGLNVRVSIMVGCPDETLKDVFLTELFMSINKEYIDDYILSTFVPVVGSESFENPEAFGIILDEREIKQNHYKNYFVITGNEKTEIVMEYKDKSREEIMVHRKHLEEFLRHNIKRNVEASVK